ncbi:MAG: choice-of-anchor D domain-containing protein [Terriglobia bacterium]|jgi:hypothetical protein
MINAPTFSPPPSYFENCLCAGGRMPWRAHALGRLLAVLVGLMIMAGCGAGGLGGGGRASGPVLMFGPTSLAFSNQTLGTSSYSQLVQLANTGTATLTLSITVSGDFGEGSDCATSVAAGAGCAISVWFTPTATGTRTGTMTITDNASGSPQTVSLTGTGVTVTAAASPSTLTFGTQAVGISGASQAVTLSNRGAGVLTITKIATTGDFAIVNSSDTCLQTNFGTTVAAGANCTLSVNFTPTATGTRAGTLTFTDNATNAPQTVSLTGTGAIFPVTLSPFSLTFSSQFVGTLSPSQPVTLTNTQAVALSISTIAASSDFSQTNNCGASVSAGGSCTISVTFTPTAAGTRNATLTVTDNANTSPQTLSLTGTGVASASFVPAGSLNTGRYGHTATLLNNGMVLIAGGAMDSGGSPFFTAELYNPATETFSYTTGNLNIARAVHTATLLNNGTVLIAGGLNINAGVFLASAELYNPATGTFSYTNGKLNTARDQHTATLLNNGTVLMAGGFGASGGQLLPLGSAELYNPATGTFTPSGSLNTARLNHTSTLLNNGMALIAGGYDSSFNASTSAELYNPASGTFTLTASLNTARAYHTATLLNNGMVLMAGGQDSSGAPLASAELYNPATGTFTATGSLNTARTLHTATLLDNGLVLMAGGGGSSGVATASAELY